MTPKVVERYLAFGLAMDRHITGFVDAYYGPKSIADRVHALPVIPPERLVAEARALLAAIDAGEPLGDPEGETAPDLPGDVTAPGTGTDASRRHFLRSQAIGLLTSARKLAGEHIGYADEVEACYGVRPRRFDEEEFEAAHRRLDEVVPGTGPLAERYVAWREAQAVPVDLLEAAIGSLAEDLQQRTRVLFGLPDGEHVDFELVTRPAVGRLQLLPRRPEVEGRHQRRPPGTLDVDRPSRGARGLSRPPHRARPQGSRARPAPEVVGGVDRPRRNAAEPDRRRPGGSRSRGGDGQPAGARGGRPPTPTGIPYDPDVVAVVRKAAESLGGVRANAAFRLFEDGAEPDTVIDEVARWGLLPRARAEKSVEFLLHPTWRAYTSCYVEGLPLCRKFVGGDPARFGRLVTEQLTPQDLIDQTALVA